MRRAFPHTPFTNSCRLRSNAHDNPMNISKALAIKDKLKMKAIEQFRLFPVAAIMIFFSPYYDVRNFEGPMDPIINHDAVNYNVPKFFVNSCAS